MARCCGPLLLVALAGGCGGSGEPARDAARGSGAWTAADARACGASASMPAPVREEWSREGPMVACVAWGVDEDGSRYEIARFDLPEPLDEAGRTALVARIEGYVQRRPGARSTARRTTEVSGVPVSDIHLALPDDRVARYWLFLVEDSHLFEVSVLGPSGDRITAGSSRFFGSFQLVGDAPAGGGDAAR